MEVIQCENMQSEKEDLWIPHFGGINPVNLFAYPVRVKLRDGTIGSCADIGIWAWASDNRHNAGREIIAYRLVNHD